MKFRNVKGTRDFYPEPMRIRNWIADAWRRVSLRNGFEEYDAPIFEYLDLLTAKSGQEIAEQLFSFTDRGGRQLAIRPEITPSLARMVNARINSLPRPIKWFSVPRLCRAENPQRGRLREFFQWNIDVIGEDSGLADAECIFTCVDFLREVGLTPEDAQVRIGSRPLSVSALWAAGVPQADEEKALAALDKRPKLNEDAFANVAKGAGLSGEQIAAVTRFQDCATLDDISAALPDAEPRDIEGLRQLWGQLEAMGVAEYCVLDLRIVRGLAYYTGIVYEVFGGAESRAVAGGGRYDNLLEVLGGPKVGATGFGMGDVVLELVLDEKAKIPPELRQGGLDYFVIDAEDGAFHAVMRTVGALRRAGRSADFSYARRALGKQLKDANRRGAANALLVRADGGLEVKDLRSGEQRPAALSDLLSSA